MGALERMYGPKGLPENGEESGVEARLREIARDSLVLAGIDPQMVPELPVRDGVIASAMRETEGLVLFEIEFVWAFCRALSSSCDGWRGALVPPFHERVSSFVTDAGVDCRERVRIRGWNVVNADAWEGHIAAEGRFAKIFATALSEMSNRFVGMIHTASELHELAGSGPVGQVRIVSRPASEYTFDPVGELQEMDDLWVAGRSLGLRKVDVVAWHSEEVNGRGYDLGHLRGDVEHLSAFESTGLREVIRLPEDEETQLFVWDSSYAGAVAMTVMGDGPDRTAHVPAVELLLRLDYTPSHYFGDGTAIGMVALGALVRRIQRGTSLNGKSLKIVGTVDVPRPGATFDFSSMSFICEQDLYYVDNASVSWGDVKPRVIAEMPAGQERYIIKPEDGKVVLIARNGKGLACYSANRPTLVSNNLFVIWPREEKVQAEYLSCAMRSVVGPRQLESTRMPMGKGDLERILIPIGPKARMECVVQRELQIRQERAELNYRLQMLEVEDPLDQLWRGSDADVEPDVSGNKECDGE